MAHQVSLAWDAPTTGDAPTSYIIQRSLAQAGPFTQVGTSTSVTFVDTDPTLVSGTTYFYEVLAANSAGDSGPSNEISVIIPFLVPNPPTNLSGTAS